MTTAPLAHTDVIVLDYLAALWAQSEDLSPELRDELMTTVADYIALRRGAASDPLADPAQIIARLGPPESLVAAARRGSLPPHLRLPALIAPPPLPPAAASGRAGAVEYAAIGLITVGSLVAPVAGPVAGMLLASGSPEWTASQKATGWLLTAGSAVGAGMFTVLLAAMGFPAEAVLLLAYMALTACSVVAGLRLLHAVRG